MKHSLNNIKDTQNKIPNIPGHNNWKIPRDLANSNIFSKWSTCFKSGTFMSENVHANWNI